MSTVGILLAAGRGQRFDPTGARNKLLHRLDNGSSVAEQSATTLLAALPRVIAVTRCTVVAGQLRTSGCEVHDCPVAELGMGASLAYAMQFVQDADSVLVALADMPYLQVTTLDKVVAALASGVALVQPLYLGQPGHPVGFARCYFSDLQALTGDVGARHVVQRYPVQRLEVDDAGVVRDVDSLADLLKK